MESLTALLAAAIGVAPASVPAVPVDVGLASIANREIRFALPRGLGLHDMSSPLP